MERLWLLLLWCSVLSVSKAKWQDIPESIKRDGFNVHIAFASQSGGLSNSTSLHVSFQTESKNCEKVEPVVSYAECNLFSTTTVGGNWKMVSGITESYYKQSSHHHVLLNNLKTNTFYCYRIGLKSEVTERFRNKTFILSTSRPNRKGFKFLSYGDLGLGRFSEGTIRNIVNRSLIDQVDFVMHGGDIGYGDDQTVPFKKCGLPALKTGPSAYETVYDVFMNQIEPLASSIPYMVIPGNHERSCNIVSDWICPQGMRNFSTYRKRFRMPSQLSSSDSMFYSFDYGNVHIIGINSETDYLGAPLKPYSPIAKRAGGSFGNQTAWLEEDLKTAKNRRCHGRKLPGCYDWIIVFGHRPMYTSRRRSRENFRRAFEPILHKYSVDVYVGAHVHYYERVGPMFNHDKCNCETTIHKHGEIYYNPKCVVHVTNGAGGNCEGIDSRGPLLNGIGKTVSNAGYAVFTVYNSSHLKWEYYSADSGSSLLEDSALIVKSELVMKVMENKVSVTE